MDRDPQVESDTELVTESLVEEVSIDGMCGVY
jgi:mycofactocin precursor